MAAVIPSCAAHRTVPLPAPATPHMHMHSYMAKLRRPAPPPSVPYAEALRLQGGAPAVDRGGVSSQQLAELKERLVALAQEKEQALLDCQVSVEAQRCLRQELLLRCDCSGCCSSSRLHFSCYCPPFPQSNSTTRALLPCSLLSLLLLPTPSLPAASGDSAEEGAGVFVCLLFSGHGISTVRPGRKLRCGC